MAAKQLTTEWHLVVIEIISLQPNFALTSYIHVRKSQTTVSLVSFDVIHAN